MFGLCSLAIIKVTKIRCHAGNFVLFVHMVLCLCMWYYKTEFSDTDCGQFSAAYACGIIRFELIQTADNYFRAACACGIITIRFWIDTEFLTCVNGKNQTIDGAVQTKHGDCRHRIPSVSS